MKDSGNTADQRRSNVVQFRRKLPQAVNTFLQSTLKRYGLSDQIARYKFVLFWPEIVGKKIAEVSKPEYFRNGSLVVRVRDSAWTQELSFQKPVILQRLKKFIGTEISINDIYFVVGEIKPEQKAS